MTNSTLAKTSLALETRQKSPIDNCLDRDKPTAGKKIMEDLKKEFPDVVLHRTMGSCGTYNCHGLTFGSRRTWIDSASDLQKIINEDDYDIVGFGEVEPGDIAVYYNPQNGDIEHSGIVLEKRGIMPIILSKWSYCHEVVHSIADCPYDASRVIYYRIQK